MTAKREYHGELISDPDAGLYGEMDQLSQQDLKERLIVAEKVMKSLFQRNKELEDKFSSEQRTTASSMPQVTDTKELDTLKSENDRLQKKIQSLEK